MFKKKYCPNCKNPVKKSDNFCPYCGYPLKGKNKKQDFGLLGKNDFFPEIPVKKNSFFDNLSQGVMDKMFRSAMKFLEKEVQKSMEEPDNGMQIFVNGKRVNPVKKEINQVKEFPKLSRKNLKNISKLPRKEPITEIRRFPNKIIYKLKIPGVSSLKDLSIVKVEKGFEIKAISKDKVYSKSIPINLEMQDYKFLNGNLTLEFDAKD